VNPLAGGAETGPVLQELRSQLGPKVVTTAADLEQHSHDESHHDSALPWAVVACAEESDVVATLQICGRHHAPVVAFGAGTGLEGGAIPVFGGISLDLSALNRVLRLSPDDLDVTVEAGVTLSQLNSTLGPEGLFFPVDPGSNPTLGGMVATRASGTTAVRYGTMAVNTLGLTAVLASGEVVKTGGRARKSAAGYDLTRLFTGSEGTLAIITSATLRVYPLPEFATAAICSMADLHRAVTAVIEIIQLGVPVARIELLDEVMVDAINHFSDLHYPVCPTLMLEFHGAPQSVAEQVQEAARVVETQGSHLTWTESAAERRQLWDARHHALYAAKALRPGARTWSTDVCVPISALADCIEATKRDIERSGVLAPIVGHVGDGNFHLSFVLEPGNAQQLSAATALHERLVGRALGMGGTCTGEHGVGLGKLGFLEDEHPVGVAVMRQLKLALDPNGILNPGKVVRMNGL